MDFILSYKDTLFEIFRFQCWVEIVKFLAFEGMGLIAC